jgi:hypothetical protein
VGLGRFSGMISDVSDDSLIDNVSKPSAPIAIPLTLLAWRSRST